MLPNVTLDEEGHLRPRTNERHLAEEHVEKLCGLIQPCAPKQASNPGDARIGWLDGRGFVHGRVYVHGAKLEDGEEFAIAAYALLREEDRGLESRA